MGAVSNEVRAHRRAYIKKWHEANPRDRREYKAAYDAEHQAENKAYRERNRERLKAAKAAYDLANRERILAGVKARAEANPDRISAYHARHGTMIDRTRPEAADVGRLGARVLRRRGDRGGGNGCLAAG